MKILFCDVGELRRTQRIHEANIVCSVVNSNGQIESVTGLLKALKQFNLIATNSNKEGSSLVWTNLTKAQTKQIDFSEQSGVVIDLDDPLLTFIISHTEDYSALLTHRNQFFNYDIILRASGRKGQTLEEQYTYINHYLNNMDVLSKKYFNNILHSVFDEPTKHFSVGAKSTQGVRKNDAERFMEGVKNGSQIALFLEPTQQHEQSNKHVEIEFARDNITVFKSIILRDIPNTENSGIQIINGTEIATQKKLLGRLVQIELNKEVFIINELYTIMCKDERFTSLTSKPYATVYFDNTASKNRFPISKGLFLPYAECSLALNALCEFILKGLINNDNQFFSHYIKLLQFQVELDKRISCYARGLDLNITQDKIILSYKADSAVAKQNINPTTELLFKSGYYPLDVSKCPSTLFRKGNKAFDKMRFFTYLAPKKELISNIVEDVFNSETSFDGSQVSRFSIEAKVLTKLTTYLKEEAKHHG